MIDKTIDHCSGFFDYIGKIYIGGCCKPHDDDYAINLLVVIAISLLLAVTVYINTGYWNWWIVGFMPLVIKFTFDFKLLICITMTGRWMFLIAIPMFIAVSTFGIIFILASQYNNHIKK